MLLQHPLFALSSVESVLAFAFDFASRFGPDSSDFRSHAMERFRRIVRASQSIDPSLPKLRPLGHVPGYKPFLLAVVISARQWPDRQLPTDLVLGFPIVGRLEPSGVFHPIAETTCETDPQLRD